MLMLVLGIRSQSKPHDIMHEVYRAMKTLGYVSVILTITFIHRFNGHFTGKPRLASCFYEFHAYDNKIAEKSLGDFSKTLHICRKS